MAYILYATMIIINMIIKIIIDNINEQVPSLGHVMGGGGGATREDVQGDKPRHQTLWKAGDGGYMEGRGGGGGGGG